ncbi:MAG: toprim domain-containing protein [Bacteroidetes bacterium]|nr:toprim domain-containing protein [Bacteroidota bacterium]
MNTAQAKKIPLLEILTRLGFQPVKTFKGGEELAFLSPFREEKEPSLFVNIRKNVWNDFGDIGGNALDFVIRYQKTDVKGGLEFLDQMFGSGFSTIPATVKTPRSTLVTKPEIFLLDSVMPFGTSAKSLVTYITQERRIPPDVAAKYLKEVRYTNRENGKTYFAVGFENMSGGYEIRNPFFKSSLGAKDMSFVKGNGAGDELYVFEGFMDFLSKLTLESVDTFSADALILNSVSYAQKAIKYIREEKYNIITGYLDNDKAGEEFSQSLKQEFNEMFFDKRIGYQAFKDINELLLSGK